MKRIMIVGGAGSGKSTTALRVGEATGLPVIHIDRIYWKNGWVFRDPEETRQMVIEAAQREEWVIDGNNSSTFKERAERADAIVFLDMPTWLRLFRVIWRTATGFGRPRPDMADGCPERLDFNFLAWVIGYRTNGSRAKALQLIYAYAMHTKTFHLRYKQDVDRFVGGLGDWRQ